MNLPGINSIKVLSVLFTAFLTACSPGTALPASTPTKTITAVLTPYQTSTLTATLSPSLLKPTQTPLPPPTATPFTHTVKKEDTLLGIAFQYGVKLEDLLAANPGVNVRFLSIGTVLIVPLDGILATPAPTPAPPLLQISQPVCYGTADSILQCLAMVVNPLKKAYENLTLRFDLHNNDGELISEQFVIPPLDRILPEGMLPLLVSFSGGLNDTSLPEDYSARFTLLSAVVVPEVDEPVASPGRFIEIGIQDLSVQFSEDMHSALVTGKAVVQQGTDSLWLVAVAFDINQQPVGLRRLELSELCPAQAETTPEAVGLTTQPGTCGELPFELVVYSLGPVIDRVELLSEAKR